MSKYLVIVESPAKSKTIQKYLGADYEVAASVGHIRDLPPSKLGVDVENDFQPEYVNIKGKEKVIRELKKAAKGKETVFLGPDPDREGEAIAWHIREAIQPSGKKIKAPVKFARVLFNEITKRGITDAMQNPLELDNLRFESQQARRILDRLVGYQISPLLWKKVKRGLSAGRVQSVAVKLITDREEEINVFVPTEYWNIHVALSGPNPPTFAAKLLKVDGKKAVIPDEETARKYKRDILKQDFAVSEVRKKEKKKKPLPPFITSTLQQEAYRKLRYTAKKTMMLAQRLYEGIELGDEGPEGLITYMRTDSNRIADEAVAGARQFIETQYGKDYLPAQPNTYKSKKGAQDAHEAIRPTNLAYPPERIKQHLDADLFKMYDLIWKRFLACQMVPVLFDETVVDIGAGPYLFQIKGEVETFPGWHRAYTEGQEDKDEKEFPQGAIPAMEKGNILSVIDINLKQNFTKPKPRYTESSLIKEMEDKGIGRPSTYAAIISTIQDKQYARKERGYFFPTALGIAVTKLLTEAFPDILNTQFTSAMEENLDEVEAGNRNWLEILKEFYGQFSVSLEQAKETMKNLKVEGQETDLTCPKSGHKLVIKWGRNGEFLACSGYPECKFTTNFKRTDEGKIEIVKDEVTDKKCEKCGKPMTIKHGKYGPFYACTGYPECKNVEPVTIMKCPKDGCKGDIVSRRTKKGRFFFGCTKYPDCDFAAWDKPVKGKCPDCGNPYLVEKINRRTGTATIQCPVKGCGYKKEDTADTPTEAPAEDSKKSAKDKS